MSEAPDECPCCKATLISDYATNAEYDCHSTFVLNEGRWLVRMQSYECCIDQLTAALAEAERKLGEAEARVRELEDACREALHIAHYAGIVAQTAILNERRIAAQAKVDHIHDNIRSALPAEQADVEGGARG